MEGRKCKVFLLCIIGNITRCTSWSARFFCPLFPMAYYSYKISLISLTNLSSILVKGELKRRGRRRVKEMY